MRDITSELADERDELLAKNKKLRKELKMVKRAFKDACSYISLTEEMDGLDMHPDKYWYDYFMKVSNTVEVE